MNNRFSQLLKSMAVLALPGLLVCIIYSESLISVCFRPGTPTSQVEELVSYELENQYSKLQILEPIITFADGWFVYDVSIANNLISTGIRTPDTNSYTQTLPIPIQLVNKNGATTTVEVGQHKTFAYAVKPVEIPGLVNSFEIRLAPSKSVIIPVDEHGNFKLILEYGPGSDVCYSAGLHPSYLFLIWLVLFIFLAGLLILLKEVLHFINQPLWSYFGFEKNKRTRASTKKQSLSSDHKKTRKERVETSKENSQK